MLRLLIAVSLAAAVCCEYSERKYCCTPPQWEGIQAGQGGMVIAGKPQMLTAVSWVAYDRTARRVFAFSNTTLGNKFNSQKIIQDFKSGYQFVIDVQKQTCAEQKIQQKFNEACIPDNAKYFGVFTLGAGSEVVKVKSFAVDVDSEESSMHIAVTVTEELCAPFGEVIVGSAQNVPVSLNVGFANLSLGIKDPSIFTPPSFCKQNTTIEYPPGRLDAKFHIFHI